VLRVVQKTSELRLDLLCLRCLRYNWVWQSDPRKFLDLPGNMEKSELETQNGRLCGSVCGGRGKQGRQPEEHYQKGPRKEGNPVHSTVTALMPEHKWSEVCQQ
jgi:hypothetical protein